MPTRVLYIPAERHVAAMARHIQGLHERNRSVLVVSTNRPAAVLLPELQKAGVNVSRVFVVDAVGNTPGRAAGDPNHSMLIPAPTLLELIAMRAEKIIRTKAEGPPHVVIDNVNTFNLYNTASALEELVRYVVSQVAEPKTWIDFILDPAGRVDPALVSFLEGFVDHRVDFRNDLQGVMLPSEKAAPVNPKR